MGLVNAIKTSSVNAMDVPVAGKGDNQKETVKEMFSQLVKKKRAEYITRIENGSFEQSYQIGSDSYTETEWKKLLHSFDAAEAKLRESAEDTKKEVQETNGVDASDEYNEDKEKDLDMLLAEHTIATYPSGDKDTPDDVYYTFYDADGIYCKKSGESGFEWKMLLKDSSQYEKVMEYLKKYEGQDNLWFASRKDFWRDFLEDKIDLDKFDSFMENRVVDGIPQFVDYFEDCADINIEALEFYKYMSGENFGHLLTEEEISKMLYPQNGGKFVINDISNINLESLYALHPDESGKKVNYYNGRWYTDYEMAVIARKELVRFSKENQFSTVELGECPPEHSSRTE